MIAILLSTYNGEKYLSDLLNSLINQTYSDWELYIRDDGSEDGTVDIIKKYCLKYQKIKYKEDSAFNLGPAKSFLKLLGEIEADYYMFCDQDDVWLSDKIELSLRVIQNEERRSINKPVLINTDLFVVDSSLNIISDSFWNYSNINTWIIQKKYFLITNFITGCTIIFNNRAKEVSESINENIIMHDYWIGLCVYASGGTIISLPLSTIYYRQHEKNVLGAGKKYLKPTSIFSKLSKFFTNYTYNKKLYKMISSKVSISFISFWCKKISYYVYKHFND
jgi:glycosyltransferase involved in cell wall biosynthesis